MIEETVQGARELLREVWSVERDADPPVFARWMGRVAERLTNVGTVLVYAVLLAYGLLTIYHLFPHDWRAGFAAVKGRWWIWVGVVLVAVTTLRFGLETTKLLRRWNVASVIGSLLIFDLLLKKAPPLLGLQGFSPVECFFGTLGDGDLAAVAQKALGF